MENYLACIRGLKLGRAELAQLAKNSITASLLSETEKNRWVGKIDALAEAA
jgi:adenosine deaminase